MKSPIQIFFALAVLLATATVAAQVYKWVDKDGRVQYTDTPPPPGATKAEPKKLGSTSTAAGPAATANPATALKNAKSGDAKVPSDKSKEANKEVEKRRIEAIEKAKKDDVDANAAKANQERCKDATTNLRDYESGRPMYRTNEAGERSFVSDEQRATEVSRMRAAMTESCKQ